MIFTAVASAGGYLAARDENFSDTQVNIATAALKRHEPDLFAADPVFGESGLWKFHTPVFQGLLEIVLVPTDYQEPMLPFRAITGVLIMVYLAGMYGLLYRQCRSWSVSAFVAVLSSTVTYALGRAFWGVGSLASISPQTFCMAAVPLVVLAFLRYSGLSTRRPVPARARGARPWRLLLVFGVVGLLGNLHLVTAMNLTAVLLVVYLGRRRFAPSAWAMAVGCGLSALAGALPYAWYYFRLHWSMTPADVQVSAQIIDKAFDLGGLAVTYPQIFESLLNWLLLVAALAIPAVAVLARVERFRTRDMGVWVWFIAAGVFVSLGLSGISQLVGFIRSRPPAVVDFVRASRLVMLPLYVLFAQALTNLFRLVRTHRGLLQWACAVLMAAWMIPSDNLRVLRHAALDTVTMFMNESDKPRNVQRHHRRHHERSELAGIAAWARANTDRNAVFLVDRIEFRMLARRAIAASPDDVRYFYYMVPSRLGGWIDRLEGQNRFLHPRTGRSARPQELKAFVAELATLPEYRSVSRWYIILAADMPMEDTDELEVVSGLGWGSHYRLYRLRWEPARKAS